MFLASFTAHWISIDTSSNSFRRALRVIKASQKARRRLIVSSPEFGVLTPEF
jgi:hypothetical protein